MYVTSRFHVGYYNLLHTNLYTLYVYISNGTYLNMFWCTIHQTFPKNSARLSGGGDIMFLISHMISQDHVIKELRDILGVGSLW